MRKREKEEWEGLSDTPEEFETAIKNAISTNEQIFFDKLRFKILHETAASNDVLMNESDNEDGIFILRVGTDDFLIGKNLSKPEEKSVPQEYAGIFLALEQDMYRYLSRHITLQGWLRERDYMGIRYDANNDYN